MSPKHPRRRRGLSAVLLLVLLAFGAGAHADSGQQTQQALQKAQGLLKQIAQQKAQAEAEVARLRGDLAGKEKALAVATAAADTRAAALSEAEATIGAASRREAGLARKLERTRTRLEQTDAKLREVAELFKAMRTRHAEAEAARQDLADRLESTSAQLRDAESRNLALYRLNEELLDQYQQKSAWDAVRQREPFTGIAGVAVENAAQDYEDRMADELLPVNEAAAEHP